jgi:hypothetical protein
MHEDIIWLGPSPANEDCAQVGDPNYAARARDECRAYVRAIRSVCGPEPEGARLVIRPLPHDYGSYFEVAVVFDPDNQQAARYAALVDDTAPRTWEEAGIEPPSFGRGGLGR